MNKEQYKHLKYLVINKGYCEYGCVSNNKCIINKCLLYDKSSCFPDDAYKRVLKILKINSLLKLF
jgi:hypothetical protein